MTGPTVRPLSGLRVVVTRSVEQAGPLRTLLEVAGAEVIEVPLLRIAPAADGGASLERALTSLDEYAWVIVTSPNGAAAVRAALAERPSGHPMVAAVGPATAEGLGRPVDLVPGRAIAEGLLDAMPAPPADRELRRVLLPQADQARTVLAEGLRQRGWVVDAVVAYRTVPVTPAAELVERALSADALLLASGSAARSWVAAVGPHGPRSVVSIGPITTRAAEEEGLKVDAEAAEHSLAGLVAALTAHFGPQ